MEPDKIRLKSTGAPVKAAREFRARWVGRDLMVEESGVASVTVFNLDGTEAGRFHRNGDGVIRIRMEKPVAYPVKAQSGGVQYRRVAILLP